MGMRRGMPGLALLAVIALQPIGCVHDRAESGSTVDSSACRGLGNPLCDASLRSVCPEATPEVATSCSPVPTGFPWPPDECACEGGTCPVGETCFRVFRRALTGGGPSGYSNICEATCSVDGDCSGSLVCRHNRYGVLVCAAPSCASDDDCTADRCGHCVPEAIGLHGGGSVFDFTGSKCMYEGPCRPDSCAGCTEWGSTLHRCTP
jgi:hypothetical protein